MTLTSKNSKDEGIEMIESRRKKFDWPAWIGATVAVFVAGAGMFGYLLNDRLNPIEDKFNAKMIVIERVIEINKENIEKNRKQISENGTRQTDLLHAIDLKLASLSTSFGNMKEDISELKNNVNKIKESD